MKPIAYFVRALPGASLSRLAERFEIRGNAPRPPPRDRWLLEAAGAVVLAPTYLDAVDEAVLQALPGVRHVASYGVGVNHIDLAACRRREVLVTNTPGVLANATADLALALLLAAARRVAEGDRLVRAGGWRENDCNLLLGTEVTGKTLGLVGFGEIGQAVARRAAGFEMRVLYAAPREMGVPGATRVPLEQLLRESDFVSLHCPLTPATRGLLDRARIRSMKRGAIVVNTARGPVVDDEALAEALRDGHVGAAGLDVFPAEPVVPEPYRALDNVVLTPHLGSGSRESRSAMSRLVTDEIERVARGESPCHPVP